MPQYTKLFNTIVTSTIWTEDDSTRIIWITMLAIADQHGEIHASIPGLARLAGKSIAETEQAIAKFCAPDKYSRTAEHDGRRLIPIPGGWELLNHAKYRKMASREDSKESAAERKRRQRDRTQNVTQKRDSHASVTQSLHIAEAEAEAETIQSSNNHMCPASSQDVCDKPEKKKTKRISTYPEEVQKMWDAYPAKGRERSSRKKVETVWKQIKNSTDVADVLKAIAIWSKSDNWTQSNGQYVPAIDRWLRYKGYEDLPAGYAAKIKRQPTLKQLKGI